MCIFDEKKGSREEIAKARVETLYRHGVKHDIWSNGMYEIAVPRHREINEITAKTILKVAKGGH